MCFAAGLSLPAVADDVRPLEARWLEISEFLRDQRQAENIPGLSAALVADGKLAWLGAFGMADVENDVPATPQTVYRIGPITRMFTAVAVLQLVQSGRVGLHQSIRDYVPEFPDKGATINLRHLLAHLSGIRGFRLSEESLNRKRYSRMVDTVELFKNDPLRARPGERFLNSSLAYDLLGVMIERVGGDKYEAFLRRHIFEPAGMTATAIEDAEAIVPRRARGYRRTPGGTLRHSPFVDVSISVPADGLVSTAEDLARFAIAFQSHTILSAEFIQVMTTVHKTNSGSDEQYGLGCFVRQESGLTIVGHGGWMPQVSAFLLIVPERRAAVVILANLERVDVAAMSVRVMKMLLE